MMKNAKAQSYIRQLCCLGLSREILIQELLKAIHAAVPSESNVFVGLDERSFPIYLIPEYIVPEAVDAYMNAQDMIATPTFYIQHREWFKSHRVLPDLRILDERFYHGHFYHLVLRPYNHYHAVEGIVRDHERPFGYFVLSRSQTQRPFSIRDQQNFERLLCYIEYGIQADGKSDVEYIDGDRKGLLVLTHNGTIVYFSEQARRMLLSVTYGVLPVGRSLSTRAIVIPPILQQLCDNLHQIFRGSDAPPPMFSLTNGFGRFVFRAQWLHSPSAVADLSNTPHPSFPSDGLIGVTIDHQEPLRLKLLRCLQNRRLSVQEQNVCLAMADRLSQPAIASQLGIGNQTVMTYVRRVYEKLEVGNREELLKKLLSEESENRA